jgi:flagellar capping protein FliD
MMPSHKIGVANALLEQLTLETARFVSVAPQRSANLNASLAALPNAFAPRVAASSNNNLLQVIAFNPPSGAAEIRDVSVKIDQIAKAQRNQGTSLELTERFEGDNRYVFEIVQGNSTHRITVNIPQTPENANDSASDSGSGSESESKDGITNQQFLQKMVAAINGTSGLNVTASIYSGALVITGDQTGAGRAFEIKDITGNAVALTGIDNITQEAQDAIFSVDGGEAQNSASNNVSLGNGLSVTLREASENSVTVAMGQDRLAMRAGIQQMVDSFNAMLEAAQGNSSDRNTRMLARNLQNATRNSRRALQEIGINIDRDGFLSVNEARFEEAAQNGRLDRFVRGGNGRRPDSFIARVGRLSENVNRNPMRHVSPRASTLPGFNEALNAFRELHASRNQPQAASGSIGMFDAYLPDNLTSILLNATS